MTTQERSLLEMHIRADAEAFSVCHDKLSDIDKKVDTLMMDVASLKTVNKIAGWAAGLLGGAGIRP